MQLRSCKSYVSLFYEVHLVCVSIIRIPNVVFTSSKRCQFYSVLRSTIFHSWIPLPPLRKALLVSRTHSRSKATSLGRQCDPVMAAEVKGDDISF